MAKDKVTVELTHEQLDQVIAALKGRTLELDISRIADRIDTRCCHAEEAVDAFRDRLEDLVDEVSCETVDELLVQELERVRFIASRREAA